MHDSWTPFRLLTQSRPRSYQTSPDLHHSKLAVRSYLRSLMHINGHVIGFISMTYELEGHLDVKPPRCDLDDHA